MATSLNVWTLPATTEKSGGPQSGSSSRQFYLWSTHSANSASV